MITSSIFDQLFQTDGRPGQPTWLTWPTTGTLTLFQLGNFFFCFIIFGWNYFLERDNVPMCNFILYFLHANNMLRIAFDSMME
jgi:hypothetical protein